ncbi:hypothetical protein ACRAWD_27625 [Caulobacter segnis]
MSMLHSAARPRDPRLRPSDGLGGPALSWSLARAFHDMGLRAERAVRSPNAWRGRSRRGRALRADPVGRQACLLRA